MPHHLRRVTLGTAALALAASPARAQDLGAVESLFQDMSAVAVFLQTGGVADSDDVTGDGLFGAGTEVLIDLNTGSRWDMELGLGASFMRGYRAVDPSLDLRTSLRAFPTITLYATPLQIGAASLYTGVTFGLVELWNAQAYDSTGATWDAEARTFELGASTGLYVIPVTGIGVFLEGGYRHRDFGSVRWTVPDGEGVPESLRALDFSGYYAQFGVQLRIEEDEDDPNDAITPPAPAGVWTLERMNGMELPGTPGLATAAGDRVLHGVLRLEPGTAPDAAPGTGSFVLELDLRQGDGTAARLRQVVDRGSYTTGGDAATREHLLILSPESTPGQSWKAERLAGRLHLNWHGNVLVFAPGNAAPDGE